jgi:cell wall-associated NlpC family hydrolase
MAGRLTRLAGRRLPIRRALTATMAVAAVAAGPALADGEWTIQSTPQPAPAASGDVWQVAPTGGTWNVGPAAAQTAPPTPEGILDNFVATSLADAAAPPLPPTPVADIAAPDVELDPDTPEVLALALAEKELSSVAADLADLRSRLESAYDGEQSELLAEEAGLETLKSEKAAKVDELRAVVDELLREAREKAAARQAATPFFVAPNLAFAPVSSTVPVIDANLSAQLDSYLAGKGSPFAGRGAVFVYQSTAVGLDPRLLVAISGAETSFGAYGPSQRIFNPFGMGPGIVYPSWDDSIAAAARNLGGSLYKGSGLVTIAQIQRRWAPIGATNDPTQLNSNWYRNVSRYYAELGGDANGSVFSDRRASQIAIPVAPGVAPGIQGTIAAPAAYGPATNVPGGGRGAGPAAVQLAVSFIGGRFVQGGESPDTGFDSSGLVQYVYGKQRVTLPRAAERQAAVGAPIAPEQLAPGDAVFFADRSGTIHHEGLYVGKGYFVHAPNIGDVVKISSLSEPYYATQYAGARRY